MHIDIDIVLFEHKPSSIWNPVDDGNLERNPAEHQIKVRHALPK